MSTASGRELARMFVEALHANGSAPDRAEKMQLYAWLVGSWELDVSLSKEDGSCVTTRGSVNAGWILEGRAIQDVFAVPGLFYGTSLRFYDAHIDAWQVFWMDPLKSVFFRMIGRADGDEIINEGKETPELARAYGLPENANAIVRWIFTEITPTSFHWLSRRSTDGQNWQLQREYFGRRLSTHAKIPFLKVA
jgi:hypothetical protein